MRSNVKTLLSKYIEWINPNLSIGQMTEKRHFSIWNCNWICLFRQFLGIWYAIQKTSTASTCLIYNVTRGEEPGEYFIEQTSQHFALGLTPLKHEYSYTGQLSAPIPELPAKLRVKFPLSKFFSVDNSIEILHNLIMTQLIMF